MEDLTEAAEIKESTIVFNPAVYTEEEQELICDHLQAVSTCHRASVLR